MKQKGLANIEQQEPQQSVPSILSKHRLLPGDRVLWIIVAILFAISLVAVYTASSQLGLREGTLDKELKRHTLTICASAVILFVCYMLRAKLLRKTSALVFTMAWIMTLLAYFTTDAVNEAHRWLNLGFFKFQPSELLKIGTIMLLAANLSARHHRINTIRLLPTTFDVRKWKTPKELNIIKDDIVPIVLPIALACAVILPAHTSSAIHLFFVSMVLLFIAGIRFKEIMKVFMVALVVGTALLFLIGRGSVVVTRVKNWIGIEQVEKNAEDKKESQAKKKQKEKDPSKDTYYSKMAIQNGGLFGIGAGRSMMRTKLTHPESDYLFALVVEEFGFLLSFVIVLLYLWIFFRSLRIFEHCEWLYAGLLAVGLAFLITSQGFIHIGVTLGVIPETGQNLPFITHSRTSMFCASIAMGIILGISRQVERGTLLPPSQMDNKHI
jgi:cell division protein FtsW